MRMLIKPLSFLVLVFAAVAASAQTLRVSAIPDEVLIDARSERRRRARVVLAEDDRSDQDGDDDDRRGAPGSTGITLPVDTDSRVDLERAIAKLPPGARTVFVLHDIEGYRHEEISRMTGSAEGTLRAQLHRARKLLMEALSR